MHVDAELATGLQDTASPTDPDFVNSSSIQSRAPERMWNCFSERSVVTNIKQTYGIRQTNKVHLETVGNCGM